MTADLVLYTNPRSRGRIVRWMLEEVGAPHRVELVPYGPPMQAPEYRAINPMMKVPALRHGASVVTECAAICAYLADAFPEAGLAPARPTAPAYYRWLFFAAGPLEAATTDRRLGFEPPEDKRRMVGYGDYARTLDALESAVSTGRLHRRRGVLRRGRVRRIACRLGAGVRLHRGPPRVPRLLGEGLGPPGLPSRPRTRRRRGGGDHVGGLRPEAPRPRRRTELDPSRAAMPSRAPREPLSARPAALTACALPV